MAQNGIYNVKVTGRRTDDEGRTIVEETFCCKGSFYMSDRYERANKSSESTPAGGSEATMGQASAGAEQKDDPSGPLNPIGDELVRATSTTKVPTSVLKAGLAVSKSTEVVAASQPSGEQESSNVTSLKVYTSGKGNPTRPAVAQEAATSSGTSHAHVQPVEQTGEPADTETECGHEKFAPPTGTSTRVTKTGGTGKSSRAQPTSPKGGQRRPSHTGTQRKHSPRSRWPRCRHAGMCCSPRSCYKAFLHTTEFGKLLNPEELASWCDICTNCSTSCGYEDVPTSPPVKEVPGFRPDRAPDDLSSPDTVPEGVPHARLSRAPDFPLDKGGKVLAENPNVKWALTKDCTSRLIMGGPWLVR